MDVEFHYCLVEQENVSFLQNSNCNDIDSIIHDEHVDIIFIYDICNDRSSLIFDIKCCLHLAKPIVLPLIRF